MFSVNQSGPATALASFAVLGTSTRWQTEFGAYLRSRPAVADDVMGTWSSNVHNRHGSFGKLREPLNAMRQRFPGDKEALLG